MARELEIAPAALRDLARIQARLSHADAGPAAARLRRKIVEAVTDLVRFPCRWPRSAQHADARARVVEGYLIVYDVDPDTGDDASSGDVRVLRVFAPRQDRSML